MKKSDFLNKLRLEKKLQLVAHSDELCSAYSLKADDSLKIAKLVFKNKFYESCVINSYYGMYNISLALLFKCGIKSENHSATIMLLNELLKIDVSVIRQAKKDRIDAQYYLPAKTGIDVDAKIAEQSINDAEKFIYEIKSVIDKISNQEIKEAREIFNNI